MKERLTGWNKLKASILLVAGFSGAIALTGCGSSQEDVTLLAGVECSTDSPVQANLTDQASSKDTDATIRVSCDGAAPLVIKQIEGVPSDTDGHFDAVISMTAIYQSRGTKHFDAQEPSLKPDNYGVIEVADVINVRDVTATAVG